MWVLPTRLLLIECDSIKFGIIRHYRRSFHLFSENSFASIILLFSLILENSLKFLTRTWIVHVFPFSGNNEYPCSIQEMFICTHLFFALLSLVRRVAAHFCSRSCILLSPIAQSWDSSTSQFHFKKANTALQSHPFSSTALIMKQSSNLLYSLCGALRFLSALHFNVDLEVSVLERGCWRGSRSGAGGHLSLPSKCCP